MATTLERPTSASSPVNDSMPLASSTSGAQNIKLGPKLALKVVLFSLITLLCLECTARVIVALGRPPQFGHIMYDQKLVLARRPPETGTRSLFFLGSSYIEQGVYADLITRRLAEQGHKFDVRNLAVRGSWPHDELFLLQNAVEHGAKPVAVFCDALPLGLGWDSRLEASYSPQLSNSIAAFELTPPSNDFVDQAKRIMLDHCYLLRFHRYFKTLLLKMPEVILNPKKPFTMLEKDETLLDMSAGGWVAAGEMATTDIVNTTVAKKTERFKKWLNNKKPDKKNLKCNGYALLQKYCKEQNVPLVLLWMPVTPQTKQVWQESMGLSETECLKGFSKMSDGLNTRFVDLHSLHWTAQGDCDLSKFVDCDHLNAAGGIATSEYISKLLLEPSFDFVLKEGN